MAVGNAPIAERKAGGGTAQSSGNGVGGLTDGQAVQSDGDGSDDDAAVYAATRAGGAED